MKAIILKEPGTADQLIVTEIPTPSISADEVLVQVKALSINPIDIKTRSGKGAYEKIKSDNPIILGWDISGVVTESKSTDFKVGDEVFGMINFPGHGKAYAEYIAVPASHLALKPSNIDHIEAAATPLAALTAWQAIVNSAEIKTGERVLIHAASGGVGHFAVQIAKHLGAYVIGTSSATNKDFVLSLGADEHIDYKTQDFEKVLKDIDFSLDTLGGDNIDRTLNVIREGGTIISLPSGYRELVAEKAKAKNINGYFIMVQSNGDDMRSIATLLEQGILKTHVSQTFSFDQIQEAHLQIESGRTVGKIVVTL